MASSASSQMNLYRKSFFENVTAFLQDVSQMFPDCLKCKDVSLKYELFVKNDIDFQNYYIQMWHDSTVKFHERLKRRDLSVLQDPTIDVFTEIDLANKIRYFDAQSMEYLWTYIDNLNTCAKALLTGTAVIAPISQPKLEVIQQMKQPSPAQTSAGALSLAQVPSTQVPSTQVPPTQVPPTQVPPTQVPPTQVPPTQVPLTQVPPTQVPPTQVPLTQVPLTQVPLTQVPTTKSPSSSAAVIPTLGPTQVPSTQIPSSSTASTSIPTPAKRQSILDSMGNLPAGEPGSDIINGILPSMRKIQTIIPPGILEKLELEAESIARELSEGKIDMNDIMSFVGCAGGGASAESDMKSNKLVARLESKFTAQEMQVVGEKDEQFREIFLRDVGPKIQETTQSIFTHFNNVDPHSISMTDLERLLLKQQQQHPQQQPSSK
jgi:hypothetical protein